MPETYQYTISKSIIISLFYWCIQHLKRRRILMFIFFKGLSCPKLSHFGICSRKQLYSSATPPLQNLPNQAILSKGRMLPSITSVKIHNT